MTNHRPVILLTLLVTLLAFSCNYKPKCSDFKTGSFIYHSDPFKSDILINRTDSIQTEKNVSSGQILTGTIVWTNDCEYEMRYLDVNFPISDSDLIYLRSQSVKTKIIRVDKDYYEAESVASGMREPYTIKIRRVK